MHTLLWGMSMRGIFRKITSFFLAALILLLLIAGFFRSSAEPTLLKLASENASAGASRLITRAVSRKVAEGKLSYEKIICFEKDYEGRITALKTNMQSVNALKSDILNDISNQLPGLHETEIGVPLGNLLLPELFSGTGPKIPVRILSVRKSDAEFISHFTQAGINQTLHRLSLRVQVNGTILVLGKILTFSAASTVLVAETVIVGQVPNTFS